MKEDIFQEILRIWKENEFHISDWQPLKEKYGYVSVEAIRGDFKHTRKKMGINRDNTVSEKKTYSNPRVGIIDVETLPAEVYTFQFYDQNIGIEQVISEVCLLSWAGKFLNESEVYSDILTVKEAPKKDTFRIVKSCWEFMKKCDVIIGHNLSGFDSKIMNTSFLKYDLPPLKYTQVDTLAVARSNFRFSSNKLSFLNRQLDIRDKISNDGFVLWRDCHQGKQEALDKMLAYNIGDIYSAESLFYKLRPYIRNFNVALYNEINEYQCPVCGSLKLTTEGHYYTSAGMWESVRCDDCKCISRKKNNLLSKEKKKSLLINS